MRRRWISIGAFLILGFSILSCTSTIRVSVMHPADIAIPADLDSVIIVDRTKGLKTGTKVGNVLESIVTGEPLAGDKYGINQTLEYTSRVVLNNERLTLVNVLPIEVLNINGSLKHEIPIRAEVIDSIAKKYSADGIISLEYFDSDRLVQSNPANSESFIRTYWRLYYPNEQQIIEEIGYETFGQRTFSYSAIIPSSYSGIGRAGMESADRFIRHIVPGVYLETREYFTKGCDELKLSKEYMQEEKWEQAAYMLEQALDQGYSLKVLSRITYNLAVVYEQLGDFQKAIDFAYKSAESGNRKAPHLIKILNTRKNEAPLIEDQLIRE